MRFTLKLGTCCGSSAVERAQHTPLQLSTLTGFCWKGAVELPGKGVNCGEPRVPHYGSEGHSFPSCGSFRDGSSSESPDGHGLSQDNLIRVSNWDSLTPEPTETAQVPEEEEKAARLCEASSFFLT